ncbi:enoyl-CoA hydratase/carnithine racemase [Palleronia aestuarii]|uniref:3-hydroxyisobutyryl-CoA hydrolase n=1 Tax=Palleronia aestuarii TaxID=568105 RepID=A0A2W7NYH9_9RHOB|nr:enoyl-CoA hydratase/isomerase family protein [Palleronia aestuarii]PZX18346.1 enoyl-CoA hydratase/carnithine racemase [Palleronia aestuarii]
MGRSAKARYASDGADTTGDIVVRKAGRAGRITLTRSAALNALNRDMMAAIHEALDAWRDDPDVDLVVMDAAGEKAFCAGGDITFIHRSAMAGDLDTPRGFWRAEYRMNACIATWPKPIVTFLKGYTLGGGVGVGCHGSHRVVGASSRIGMPECAIGLAPDAGGTLLLARAPGRIGEYLGTTAMRMGPACAIHAGFADLYVPEGEWDALIRTLEAQGKAEVLAEAATDPGSSKLASRQDWIDRTFDGATLSAIVATLRTDESEVAAETLDALSRVSPLAAATALPLIREVRAHDDIHAALELEYRAISRAIEEGDMVEGIRAKVIDRDGAPRWRYATITDVPEHLPAEMLAPLGDRALSFAEEG